MSRVLETLHVKSFGDPVYQAYQKPHASIILETLVHQASRRLPCIKHFRDRCASSALESPIHQVFWKSPCIKRVGDPRALSTLETLLHPAVPERAVPHQKGLKTRR